ncbi:MAG: hypothetical protein KC589_05080 [Nanoarchaeota archaeon]|nr:hypothetical protein [Nanoarchaeota archaeon]
MVNYNLNLGEIQDLGNLFKENDFKALVQDGVFTLQIEKKYGSIDKIEEKLNRIIVYVNAHANYNFRVIIGKVNLNGKDGEYYEFPLIFKKK